MGNPHGNGNDSDDGGGGSSLAFGRVAKFLLASVVVVVVVVAFPAVKPQAPKIAISAVQLPSFSVVNGAVNFTLSQYVSVQNPNKASLSHYDSSIQLLYSGSQIGFMFIPAGEIDAGRTQYISSTFSAQTFPSERMGPTLEVESKIEMAGRVRILHFFSRHVETTSSCRVAIVVSDGSVLGFHC